MTGLRHPRDERLLYWIFFASGLAGLIYEAIWTHYLKLFLGHAAYAQVLVLGIFMAGMAVGAALAAPFPQFVKPVMPKQFSAAAWTDRAALRRATDTP